MLVAEHEAQLVGYVSGYCHFTFYAGGQTAWVDEAAMLACAMVGAIAVVWVTAD